MDITIKLKVKGIELELTRQEAKELADALDGLTGTERLRVVPYEPMLIPWYPTSYPTYPPLPWYGTPVVWSNISGTVVPSVL